METQRTQSLTQRFLIVMILYFLYPSSSQAQYQIGFSTEFQSISEHDYGILWRPWLYGIGVESQRFESVLDSKFRIDRRSANVRSERVTIYRYAIDFPSWSLVHSTHWHQDQRYKKGTDWVSLSILETDLKARTSSSLGLMSLHFEAGPSVGAIDPDTELFGLKCQIRTLVVVDQHLSFQGGASLQQWMEDKHTLYRQLASFGEWMIALNETYDGTIGIHHDSRSTFYMGVTGTFGGQDAP